MADNKNNPQEAIPTFAPLYEKICAIIQEAQASLPKSLHTPKADKFFSDAVSFFRNADPDLFPKETAFAILRDALQYGIIIGPARIEKRAGKIVTALTEGIDATNFEPGAKNILKAEATILSEKIQGRARIIASHREQIRAEAAKKGIHSHIDEALLGQFIGESAPDLLAGYRPSGTLGTLMQAIRAELVDTDSDGQHRIIFNLHLYGEEPAKDGEQEGEQEKALDPIRQQLYTEKPDDYLHLSLNLIRKSKTAGFITPLQDGKQPEVIIPHEIAVFKDIVAKAGMTTPDGKPLDDYKIFIMSLIYSYLKHNYEAGKDTIAISEKMLYQFWHKAATSVPDSAISTIYDTITYLSNTSATADITEHFKAFFKRETHSKEEAEKAEMEARKAWSLITGNEIGKNDPIIPTGQILQPIVTVPHKDRKRKDAPTTHTFVFKVSDYKRIQTANGTEEFVRTPFYPFLLWYAGMVKQIGAYPAKLFTIESCTRSGKKESWKPIKMTDDRIAIVTYLIDRLHQASNANAKRSDCTISCESLYKEAGCAGSTRAAMTERKRLRDYVESSVFAYWKRLYKEDGTGLYDYDVILKGNVVKSYLIFTSEEQAKKIRMHQK